MEILKLEGLTKRYDKFALDNVSFTLEEGYIMGFIGRNGAGKSTTIKTMLNLVHKDAGEVHFMGREFIANEEWCKQRIGLVMGGWDFYPKRKLAQLAKVTSRFYTEWDDAAFVSYMNEFKLDDTKRVDQLSAGMKVKFALALALSHNASLLVLDEPTSGLDPVSRDEILEIFQDLIERGSRSILFSTHITSDLEKCADYITYIKDGSIRASETRDAFVERFRIVKGAADALSPELEARLIGVKKHAYGFAGLLHASDLEYADGMTVDAADLDSIMIHYERED